MSDSQTTPINKPEPKLSQSRPVKNDEFSNKSLIFTLLITKDRKCNDCFDNSIYILIGKDNEFIGFFCEEHGKYKHKILESKYHFERENKLIKPIEKVILICLNCNLEFKKKYTGQIYCKPSCKEAAWRKRNPERNKQIKLKSRKKGIKEFCTKCKKVFYIDNTKYLQCINCRENLPIEEAVEKIEIPKDKITKLMDNVLAEIMSFKPK